MDADTSKATPIGARDDSTGVTSTISDKPEPVKTLLKSSKRAPVENNFLLGERELEQYFDKIRKAVSILNNSYPSIKKAWSDGADNETIKGYVDTYLEGLLGMTRGVHYLLRKLGAYDKINLQTRLDGPKILNLEQDDRIQEIMFFSFLQIKAIIEDLVNARYRTTSSEAFKDIHTEYMKLNEVYHSTDLSYRLTPESTC